MYPSELVEESHKPDTPWDIIYNQLGLKYHEIPTNLMENMLTIIKKGLLMKNIQLYENYIKECNERLQSNQEMQDKIVIIISIVFIILMSFLIDFEYHSFVVIFNTISLICTLLSFIICNKGIEKDMLYAEEYYLNNKKEYFNKISIYTKLGLLLNFISLLSTIATIISFTIMFI